MPRPESLRKIIGPSAIISAMAIGAGELILWPVLVAEHGYGLLWLIPLALVVQYFWLIESTRWTIATGEGWIQATGRIPGRQGWVALWLLVMTVSLVWPGWAIASAVALWAFTGGVSSPIDLRLWGIIAYGIAVLALVLPRYVYTGIHYASMASIVVFISGLALASIGVAIRDPSSLIEAARGMVSFGSIPEGVDMRLLASAIAWAGLGAMGNAFYSLLVRDRGWGMAAYVGRIPGLLGEEVSIARKGFMPKLNSEGFNRLRAWARLLEKEGLLLFFLPSLITLFLFTYLAGAVLHPKILSGEIAKESLKGIGAVLVQSSFFETLIGPIGKYVYLIVAVFALWSTQIGLLDAMSRTWADTLAVYSGKARRVGIKKLYLLVLAILVAIGLTVILSGAYKTKPVELLKLAAYLGLIQQIVSIPVTLVVNHKLMPREMQKAAGVKPVFSAALALGTLLYLLVFIAGM